MTLITSLFVQEVAAQTQEKDKGEWTGNIYRSKKYSFRIAFPINWSYDSGEGKTTLARAYDRSKGVTISIGVTPATKNDANLSDSMYKVEMLKLLKLQNMVPDTLVIKAAYLHNFPGRLIYMEDATKSGLREVKFYTVMYQALVKNNIYTLTLNAAEGSLDEDLLLVWNRAVSDFKFEFYLKD